MPTTSHRPLPTPKPAHSPKLRDGRWEVNIASPMPERPGSWKVHTTGRFVTQDGARRWAEGMRKDGDRAQLTRYRAVDGWQSHAAGTLDDNGWRSI